jgi:polyphosphate kinase
VREILDVQLMDSVKARLLQSDGSTVRAKGRVPGSVRSQERIYEMIGGAQHD